MGVKGSTLLSMYREIKAVNDMSSPVKGVYIGRGWGVVLHQPIVAVMVSSAVAAEAHRGVRFDTVVVAVSGLSADYDTVAASAAAAAKRPLEQQHHCKNEHILNIYPQI